MARHLNLLELDPDLGEGLDADREEMARRHLVVRVEEVPTGTWRPVEDLFGASGGLGLVVAKGLALRRVSLGHRSAAELLGPGDVLQPWEDDGEHAAFPFASAFRVLEPLALGVIDAAVTARLMHFPEIVTRLMGRVMARSRRVTGHLVIAQLPSVDTRLQVILWHLADRFGRVRPEGVTLPVRLTHETLGLVIGARRPSVTAAIGRLSDQGLIEPLADGGWLLKGEAPETIAFARRR
jgi:CRP/FNR family transcriptional regulator, cyclic AMP receptor protein